MDFFFLRPEMDKNGIPALARLCGTEKIPHVSHELKMSSNSYDLELMESNILHNERGHIQVRTRITS